MACGLWSAACGVPNYSAAVNEIVIFSVGSRSAVSIPGGENFILAKNLPLARAKSRFFAVFDGRATGP